MLGNECDLIAVEHTLQAQFLGTGTLFSPYRPIQAVQHVPVASELSRLTQNHSHSDQNQRGLVFPFLTTTTIQFFAHDSSFFSLPCVQQHSRDILRLLTILLRIIQLHSSSSRRFSPFSSSLDTYLLERTEKEDFLLQAFTYYAYSFYGTSPLCTIAPFFTGLSIETRAQVPQVRCVFHACDELKMFFIMTQVSLILVMSEIATKSDHHRK